MKCLSFDIAKGKSVVGLFDGEMNQLIPPCEIAHTREELENLLSLLNQRETEVILEATSVYHYPVCHFFEKNGFRVIVVNPIISKRHRQTLRATKTDRIDCINLAHIYFNEFYNLQNSCANDYKNMQARARHIDSQLQALVKLKNRFHQVLELVFPLLEYEMAPTTLFKPYVLNFLCMYQHPEIIGKLRIDRVVNVLSSFKNTKTQYSLRTGKRIKELAQKSLSTVEPTDYLCEELQSLASDIQRMQIRIDERKLDLIKRAREKEDYHFIRTIPGFGDYSTAALISELKDISAYKTPKQLNAAAGLDPTIIQSGKSINYHGPISKKGSRLSRKILFNVVVVINCLSARDNPENLIATYYKKKRSEGKHHYACVIACTTKLLRIIHTLCCKKMEYCSSLTMTA